MPSSPKATLYTQTIDDLGRMIVDGDLTPGTVVLAEHLELHLQVSRSVVREALRVLQAMGLVESVKRVGSRVLPHSQWNAFDPRLIRWRLEGPGRGAQLRSLTELRSATEPAAAELAAQFSPQHLSCGLISCAAQMRAAGRSGDAVRFLDLDRRFHRLLLRASGNEMLATLDGAIGAILSSRAALHTDHGYPHEEQVQWHMDVADAIQGGSAVHARESVEQIMNRTMSEIESVWAQTPLGFA